MDVVTNAEALHIPETRQAANDTVVCPLECMWACFSILLGNMSPHGRKYLTVLTLLGSVASLNEEK